MCRYSSEDELNQTNKGNKRFFPNKQTTFHIRRSRGYTQSINQTKKANKRLNKQTKSTKIEMAALEAVLVALTTSCGERENAPSQSLEKVTDQHLFHLHLPMPPHHHLPHHLSHHLSHPPPHHTPCHFHHYENIMKTL